MLLPANLAGYPYRVPKGTLGEGSTLSPTDEAGAVGLLADADAQGVFGQEFLDEFGPLDEAEGLRVIEIVLVAHVVDLLEATDAIEVEMIDGVALGGSVLIDDGKGGGGDDVLDAECFAEGLDEGGLACSHLTVEGHDAVAGQHFADELVCGLVNMVNIFNCNHLCKNLRTLNFEP